MTAYVAGLTTAPPFHSLDSMTSDASNSAQPDFAEGIAAAVAASEMLLPGLSKAERNKVHRKNLRGISFHQGHDGVKAYKTKHPEAKDIRVNIDTLAYTPKPKGYDDYLVQLVEIWLTNNVALVSTNIADVGRLNVRFETTYPPSKHFSEPLSKGRLNKIRAVFARHQSSLDIAKATTMSKIREAAKAAQARVNSDRPFGNVGVVSGNTLIIHQQTFAIERNGSRQCIRVMIGDKRQRLYLDELEWIADLLVPRSDPLSSTTLRSIGELAYTAEPVENVQDEDAKISGLAYLRGGLGDRLDALKRSGDPLAEALPDDVDPLTLWSPADAP